MHRDGHSRSAVDFGSRQSPVEIEGPADEIIPFRSDGAFAKLVRIKPLDRSGIQKGWPKPVRGVTPVAVHPNLIEMDFQCVAIRRSLNVKRTVQCISEFRVLIRIRDACLALIILSHRVPGSRDHCIAGANFEDRCFGAGEDIRMELRLKAMRFSARTGESCEDQYDCSHQNSNLTPSWILRGV